MGRTHLGRAAFAAVLALALLAPATEAREPEVAHDDGTREDKRSAAGSGHAVRFDRPGPDFVATHVRVHGERYGGRYDPFYAVARVSLCDDAMEPFCQTVAPYTSWQPGKPGWADVPIGPCKVPASFYVVVEFFPSATRGVYGKAIEWVITNRRGKPFEAVRLYRLADLKAGLLDVLGDEEADAIHSLFGP